MEPNGKMISEYHKTLPKKRMGAGALILNEKNEILLVKPSYKDYWSVAGGVVDENESPRAACIREVKEEIGVDLKVIKFLCVDYHSDTEEKGDSLQFMFYGGKLSEDDVRSIKIDGKEIVDYRFVSLEQAIESLGGVTRNLAERLPKCLDALKHNTGIYLEDGK